jgi:hypothetical protein
MSDFFQGMRGTFDWVADQREEWWRRTIIHLDAVGTLPLLALTGAMPKETLTDPKFHWWTEDFPHQATDISDVYTDDTLSTLYTGNGVTGDMIFVKITADGSLEFRFGHTVSLRDSTDLSVDVVGKVVDRKVNGDNSYLQVKLLENDDNGIGTSPHNLSNADRVLVVGNANPEGGGVPESIMTNPKPWFNYTQIFRTAVEMTGTAMNTNLRTDGGKYLDEVMQRGMIHGLEMEKTFLFGVPSETTSPINGKPERTTLGLIPAIRGGYAGQNTPVGTYSDYTKDTEFKGKVWEVGGTRWIDDNMEIIKKYTMREHMAFCGNSVIAAINRLAKVHGDSPWGPDTTKFGIKVKTWVTPFGDVSLKTHPLFNYEPSLQKAMVLFEPNNLKYRPLQNRDTKFFQDTSSGYTRIDGKKEEYLTEAGLEYHYPVSMGYLTGFGLDNNIA